MASTVQKELHFGVIGCGLMGREFASAAARWCHLLEIGFRPVLVAVCDLDPRATAWFKKNVPSVRTATNRYQDLLVDEEIDAIYCAVPHHLHAQLYADIIHAGKGLLGEKPFGIDLEANRVISAAIQKEPAGLVRCSSEFPFFPAAYKIAQWVRENRFGRIIEVEAGLWHGSDLDPNKPINWKRTISSNGEYGCMGDLGMHVLHLPLRFGWKPKNVRALLSNIVKERPNHEGQQVPCETWDNAILACEVESDEQAFPMTLSMKRIAPGHSNTWFLNIYGTDFSVKFNTQNPKQLATLPYTPGGEQAWHVVDVPYRSAYRTTTDGIFEFGFSDSVSQMWAAFCDELLHGAQMQQPLYCATPEEATQTHRVFTAALESQRSGRTVSLGGEG